MKFSLPKIKIETPSFLGDSVSSLRSTFGGPNALQGTLMLGLAGTVIGAYQDNANRQAKAAEDAQKQAEKARAQAIMLEFGRRQQASNTMFAGSQRSGSNQSRGNSTVGQGFLGEAVRTNQPNNSGGLSGTF